MSQAKMLRLVFSISGGDLPYLNFIAKVSPLINISAYYNRLRTLICSALSESEQNLD